MKLSLSNVLELGQASKGNFDARKARGLLSFFPLDPATDETAGTSRRRYTVADAVAIDLFERGNADTRIDNNILDVAIANNAGFIRQAIEGSSYSSRYEKPDLYIGVALYAMEGRWHFEGGTLAEIEGRIPAYYDASGVKDDVSILVLLNISAAERRVHHRMHQGHLAGEVSNVFKDDGE